MFSVPFQKHFRLFLSNINFKRKMLPRVQMYNSKSEEKREETQNGKRKPLKGRQRSTKLGTFACIFQANLPQQALVFTVHGPQWAAPFTNKVLRVGQRPKHPEFSRRVWIGQDLAQETIDSHFFTPNLNTILKVLLTRGF